MFNNDDRKKEKRKGHYYTLPHKFKIVGIVLTALSILVSPIVKFLNVKFLLVEHRPQYHAIMLSLAIIGLAMFVFSRKKREDEWTRYVRNRTNWFALIYAIFYLILTINEKAFFGDAQIAPEGFVTTILIVYYVFFLLIDNNIIKNKDEELDQIRKGKD